MKEKYGIGVIGSGMIAEAHISNLVKTKRARIKWVTAKSDNEKLLNLKSKYPVENISLDYQDILNDPGVDAVIVATPPVSHHGIFMEVVQSAKHILLEKPSAMSLDQLDQMIAAKDRQKGLMVMEASCRHSRLQPKYRYAKQIIESGRLGEIYFIHHNCVYRQFRPGIEYHPSAKWFLNKKISGGGPLFDWGLYDLSFHLGLLGDHYHLKEIKSIFFQSNLDDVDPQTDIYDVEEHFMTNLEFTGGLKYYWERGGHANVDVPNESRIYGTQGGIKLSYCTWDSNDLTLYTVGNNGKGKANSKTTTIDLGDHDDHYAIIEHFINVMDGTEKNEMPLELARKHLDIVLKCDATAYNKS